MQLLDFIGEESSVAKHRIIFMSVISGIANAVLLAMINHAAENVSNDSEQSRYFIMYILAFLLFIYTQKYALHQSMLAIEEALRKVRVRIANKLRHTEYSFIENNARSDLYLRLTQDTNVISQSIMLISSAAQASILVVACLIYIAWISPLSFLISSVIISITVYIYLDHRYQTRQQLVLASKTEKSFFITLSHLLDGFKELKLNQAKNNAVFEDIEKTSLKSEAIKIQVGEFEVTDWIISRLCFYTLLPILVFIVPLFDVEQSGEIFKITAAVLFIMGPINILVGAIPTLNRVNVTLDSFIALEKDIDAATHANPQTSVVWRDFKQIEFKNLCFNYYDKQERTLFSTGPNNLVLEKGELLFIVGGNGSGKSTLLKLLTGLYYPATGSIHCDERLINDINYASFRELFSAVFTDFHLFNRLYGLKDIDEEKLNYWLKKMALDEKTSYSSEGYFTNTNLSTGQRKRLAFIATILEDKPIMIFDELAADQDPTFRRYFYEQVLPDLKKQGKTIIAVSHDEHYFHCADRVLKMDDGLISEYHVE